MMKTTTEDPNLIKCIFCQDSGMGLVEDFSTPSILVPVVIIVILACCFLCCFPAFIHSYCKNLEAHRVSPLFPLVHTTFYFIIIGFSSFFVLIAFSIGSRLMTPNRLMIYSTKCLVLIAMAIFCYLGFYQMMISIISILRFWKTKDLTRKNVKILMFVVFLALVTKDLIWIYQLVMLTIFSDLKFVENHFWLYFKIYAVQQNILILAMVLEHINKKLKNFHSEVTTSSQIRKVGMVKFILGTICVICFITDYHWTTASIIFLTVDFFLVPFAIEVVEIKSDPNEVTPMDVKKIRIK